MRESGIGRSVAAMRGFPGRRQEPAEEVFTITEAQRGLSVEQVPRQTRYIISMLIRTVCVVGAIFIPGWPRWVLIAGAIALPYLAVVIANAGRENDEPGQVGVTAGTARALPSGAWEPASGARGDRPT